MEFVKINSCFVTKTKTNWTNHNHNFIFEGCSQISPDIFNDHNEFLNLMVSH